ncbi:MAG: DUF3592 domain-containing protein [Firmicutes bacterium]|nr:DUF3592 domain-containing protein [Bacillota bacterium]
MEIHRHRKVSPLKILALILLLIGIGFLIPSVFFYKDADYLVKNGILTDATIIEIITIRSGDDENKNAIVEYFVNGQKYVNNLGFYSKSMRVGQTVQIRYLPENPNRIIRIKTGLEFVLFLSFSSLGIGFLVTAVISFIIAKKGGNLRGLRETGQKINAVITSAIINNNIRPYGRVYCKAKDGEAEYKSKIIYDVTLSNFNIGDKIDVYENTFNRTKYYVDVEGYLKAKHSSENQNEIF